MASKESIENALNAHSKWKVRLLDAIKESKSDFKVEEVQKDNACEFGKWLYSLSDSDRKVAESLNIKELHANFHKEAATILELAVNGKKTEALAKMDFGGGYRQITGKLVVALTKWKDRL